MSSISVVSFVYNEEINIDKWLSNLKPYVDEILIFDLESTDDTYELCKKYTDKVYKRPYLLCGDYYKQELHYLTKSNWVLWSYPDERFNELLLKSFEKLIQHDRWNAYAFMRHEYMDGIRICFKQDDKTIAFGTPESPNYQNRLHKNDGHIFYTEFVHAELHGDYKFCGMPPEYYIEHFKTSRDQEFDNIRLYCVYKESIWKFRNTLVSDYKKYIDSYRKIIFDSEKMNLSGQRKIHLAEEFWWEWDKYIDMKRITLEEFKAITGVEYFDFLENVHNGRDRKIIIDNGVIDEKLRVKE